MIEPGTVYIQLGRNIKKIRNTKKMTQMELGLIIGVSQTSVSNIEKGVYHIPIHVLFYVADALQTTPQYILSDEN